MSWVTALDVYNAMSDAENGFGESPALERLSGVKLHEHEGDEDELDYDDVYDEKELAVIDNYLAYHKEKPLHELMEIYDEKDLNLIMGYLRGQSTD